MAFTQKEAASYRTTVNGRALHMYHSVLKGAKQRDIGFELSQAWFKEKIKDGICEVTGIPLVLTYDDNLAVKSKGQNRHPFAPSVDRIDSNLPYTEDNCKMVISIYNTCKGSFTDESVEIFCKAFLKAKGLI
jgi:hypothetical protein